MALSAGFRFFKLCSHCVGLSRHVQIGEYIKGGRQLSSLRFGIALFARKEAEVPVAVSKTVLVAKLQAERFLFFEQRKILLQPVPVFQDHTWLP